jgi:transcriptional regulator with XRE-family HTH domain
MNTNPIKPRYEPMAATMRRARMLLHMNQRQLCRALEVHCMAINYIERARAYPSRPLVERFVDLYHVNLDVYDWARSSENADVLPGLLGLVPAHIVRLYERRLVDASVREGRSRPLKGKKSVAELPSLV